MVRCIIHLFWLVSALDMLDILDTFMEVFAAVNLILYIGA